MNWKERSRILDFGKVMPLTGMWIRVCYISPGSREARPNRRCNPTARRKTALSIYTLHCCKWIRCPEDKLKWTIIDKLKLAVENPLLFVFFFFFFTYRIRCSDSRQNFIWNAILYISESPLQRSLYSLNLWQLNAARICTTDIYVCILYIRINHWNSVWVWIYLKKSLILNVTKHVHFIISQYQQNSCIISGNKCIYRHADSHLGIHAFQIQICTHTNRDYDLQKKERKDMKGTLANRCVSIHIKARLR